MSTIQPYVEGPFMVGILLGGVLSGIIIMQGYNYFSHCQNDSRFLKSFAGFLIFLNLLNSSTNFATMLDHFVYNAGPENIFYTSQLFHVNFFLAPFVSGSVQAYFIYRLWVVSRSYLLLICTGTLSLLCFASSLIVPSLISSTLAINRVQIQDFILVARWTSVLVDVVISVAFAKTSYRASSDYSLPGGYIITKLFHMCLQCAVFTAGVAFVNAICTSIDNNSFKSQGYTAFLLSPAYVSSLLYVLNARKSLQEFSMQNRPMAPAEGSQSSELTQITRSTSTKTFGDFVGVTNISRHRASISDTFNVHLKSLAFKTGEEFLRRDSATSQASPRSSAPSELEDLVEAVSSKPEDDRFKYAWNRS